MVKIHAHTHSSYGSYSIAQHYTGLIYIKLLVSMVINSAHNISVYVGTYMYLLDGHTIYVVIYIETVKMCHLSAGGFGCTLELAM